MDPGRTSAHYTRKGWETLSHRPCIPHESESPSPTRLEATSENVNSFVVLLHFPPTADNRCAHRRGTRAQMRRLKAGRTSNMAGRVWLSFAEVVTPTRQPAWRMTTRTTPKATFGSLLGCINARYSPDSITDKLDPTAMSPEIAILGHRPHPAHYPCRS